jgi:deoxyribodipyrimidine photo-lyase
MPSLLWFRRDLRLHDHPALAAAAGSAEVLACFVLDPRLEASSGRRRLQFLGDSLRQLRDDLDGRLLVTRGLPEEQIPRIAKDVGASSVHISEDFAPFGRRRDERVGAALGSVPLVATGSPYLVSPGRVTKGDGTPYRVFTAFFHKWSEIGWRAPAQSGADSAGWLNPAQVALQQCEIPDPGAALHLAAGERAALSQWAAFVDNGLDRYAEDRDRPDLEGTSRMSAHLKFGTIHPRTMVAGLDLNGTGARSYLRELAFRDFYAAVLHHWPASAWRNWNGDFDSIQTDTGADAKRRFESWKAGQTGFPLVDAGMRQLRETWPATSTGGSGARDVVPTPHRTSGCSIRPSRARSSIPWATTSGAGCPSWALSTMSTCAKVNGRPDTLRRSSTTVPSAPKRCAAITASDVDVARFAHLKLFGMQLSANSQLSQRQGGDMVHSLVRTLLVSGAAAGLMASVGACSCSVGSSHSVSKSDVASQISAKMTDAAGNKPDSVTCPSDLLAKVGAQVNCEMKVKDQTFNVNVTVTSVNGNDVKFDMVETVDKNQVANVISDKLTQRVGTRPESVTCPDNLKGVEGATLRCQLTDSGKKYGVNVIVTSVDAGDVIFDFKVDDQPE